MKRTIAVKRAELLKEWFRAKYANDEDYYYFTLVDGIPDGDTYETVMDDLKTGVYDDCIDEILACYNTAKRRYSFSGYYYNGNVYHSIDTLLDVIGRVLPDKIYKK